MNTSKLSRLLHDEDGGAYTLSYVMVVPFVMLFMCLIIESTLMLSAKVGTVYAAYAGARVGSVWSSATTWSNAESRIEAAAIKAFVPFASGSSARSPGNSGDLAELDRYYASYEEFASDPVSAAYVGKKFKNAAGALQVKNNGRPATWDADITVTVRYKCPFRIPGIGRLLGEGEGNGQYYFPLTSKVSLQNEGAQNDQQTIGIGYGTLD